VVLPHQTNPANNGKEAAWTLPFLIHNSRKPEFPLPPTTSRASIEDPAPRGCKFQSGGILMNRLPQLALIAAVLPLGHHDSFLSAVSSQLRITKRTQPKNGVKLPAHSQLHGKTACTRMAFKRVVCAGFGRGMDRFGGNGRGMEPELLRQPRLLNLLARAAAWIPQLRLAALHGTPLRLADDEGPAAHIFCAIQFVFGHYTTPWRLFVSNHYGSRKVRPMPGCCTDSPYNRNLGSTCVR
jgi:hypothetical protein